VNLFGIPRSRLGEILGPVVDRKFRVDQIYRALYDRGVCEFAEMTELGKDLRLRLAERFRLELPEVAARRESADGTVKYLLRLADGANVETVDIPDGNRRTICLSSQAGCALACRFCVTGFWGGGRNLTAGEIVSQVLIARRHGPPRASGARESSAFEGLNLVFMGMGEPLLNLDHLSAALEILLERISRRRITVSTAGVVPGIEALARWSRRPRLAISLHAPDDDRRSEIMPINKRYPLQDLIGTLRRYPLDPRDHLTFEYLLIRGFNDAPGDADAVADLLRGLSAKVNLIPLNPDPVLGSLQPPSPKAVQAFRQRLLARGLVATTRQRRGDDVSAACGQLRAPDREPRGFPRVNLDLLPAR
jgi:23S rRNA (adenine2503-C2)-methyltransferase